LSLSSKHIGGGGGAFRAPVRPSAFDPKQGPKVKLYLEEFEEEECRFWFAVCPASTEIAKIIQSQERGSFKYNNGLKLWLLDMRLYEKLVCEIAALPASYCIEEIPRFVLKGIKHFCESAESFKEEPVLDLDPVLAERLLPFQHAGAKFIIKRNGNYVPPVSCVFPPLLR